MPGSGEREPKREAQSDSPYVRASRYVADEPALAAYAQAQDVLFSTECDLSAYRIRYKEVPHVVVLGSLPTPEIDGQLTKILEVGEPANLPQNVVITLAQRRIQAKRIGPWVEGHYRPGQQM